MNPTTTLAVIGLGYVGLPTEDLKAAVSEGGLEPTTDPRRIASASAVHPVGNFL